ncbi:nucleolar protein 8 isoform X2 [Oxyura jamaicensis]|uniref:nucleolar protein 8 isoform X2 n=1 Tax=Oxyura jamaicensis TaxID=8884 RepID=UPI0015A52F9C|nr:nucleolar protein 8 isoform X2 [Oxyura jamaicensis]
MEKEQTSKRLYVGGLGHTVSKAELQERFGKFGRVLDVEIITRKDDQGNPTKTFAYVTANISETDLKKCVSILNKAKWKGQTLQVELAKESFLHRLAMEREEARLQKEKTQKNDKTSLLESLKKAGVVDFHMKAVPGTEVPDHKNWVVGKFGRVLPILHLRSQQKNKIVKYDPSKYCHNLRKLEQDLTQVVPVSKLTWHLEEKDDSISKKRQGEFPVTKKQPKKLRQLDSEGLNGSAALPSGCWPHSKNMSSSQLDQRSKNKSNERSKLLPSSNLYRRTPGQGSLSDKTNISRISFQNNIMHVSNGDIDSEEEISTMVKKEMERQEADVETESDHLEIVGVNFELKYNAHWSLGNLDTTKKVVKGNNKEKETVECDNGYDSADTDEIIAESKGPDRSSMKTAFLEDSKLEVVETKEILTNKKCDLANDSSLKTHRTVREGKIREAKSSALPSTAKTSDSESSYSDGEEGESEISSDYESMMQNCYRLDLTLDDLKALASENSGTSVEELDSTQSSSQCSMKENAKGNVTHKTKLSTTPPAVKKKCICPEDIVAAILEGEENADEESSKRHNGSCLKYQPFRGMGSLFEKELTKDSAGLKKSLESLGVEDSVPYCGEKPSEGQSMNHPFYSLEVSKENEQSEPCEQHKLSDAVSLIDENDQPVCRPHLQGKRKRTNYLQEEQNLECGDAAPSTNDSEGESSDVDSNAAVSQKHMKQQLKSSKLLSNKKKKVVSNTSSECEVKKCESKKMSLLENKELHGTASKESNTKKKQLQDNQRRLAALEERQKERELQKKVIQGALSNLDSQPASKRKHITFDSDVESEAEVDEMLKEDESLGNVHEKESAPKTSGKLFESSEDEQDDTDDERFKIKPQFEGKAGEKLLNLQSRFGTDERFRMDARFLESDSEEEETNTLKADEEDELAAEKKKNLQILGSLLNIDLEHTKPTKNKMATNAKKFKDINALRYDPTRQDHAVFERKPNATEKESKAKRKKKRKESEKLPEVSKEIYYNIAVDLKQLFGSSKSKPEKREEIPWDKDDAEESTPHDNLGPDVGSNTAQNCGGFTFSFFGDVDQSNVKEEPYVLETIKPVKVSWQEDPRFQDSSSEDDDEPEATESERDKEMFSSLPQAVSARLFFFSKDDERLKEGPKLFCRSINLSEEKDSWEDRRRLLLEECRKKHKDARRKVKTKQ